MKEKIKEYLEWKGTYAKRASVNYRIWLERLLEVYGEEKGLEDYTISDYIKFKCWLETRYNSYSLQFATIVIKNFFQYCKYQNYPCNISPTLIKLPRIIAKSHRAITEEERRIRKNNLRNFMQRFLRIKRFIIDPNALGYWCASF